MAKEIPKPEGWGELDPKIAKSSPRDFAKPLQQSATNSLRAPTWPPKGSQ